MLTDKTMGRCPHATALKEGSVIFTAVQFQTRVCVARQLAYVPSPIFALSL